MRFCRSKCHKNFKKKRNPCKVKWTKAYRRLHGKDMTQDATFKFERKRNRPENYDSNVTENTLKAIKKIDKVRVDREARHHAQRQDEGRKGIVAERGNKRTGPEHSHGQSSCYSLARALPQITTDQGQGFPRSNRGQSHGGEIGFLWSAICFH